MRSPALIISIAALVFATAGTSLAASRYLITKTSQIKPSVRNSLKGAPGINGTNGLPGPSGPAGPQGAPGPSATSKLTRATNTATIGAGQIASVTANCPPGQNAVSGGYTMNSGVAFIDDGSGSSWTVGVDNSGFTSSASVTVDVYCAASGVAVAARHRGMPARFQRLLTERKAAHGA